MAGVVLAAISTYAEFHPLISEFKQIVMNSELPSIKNGSAVVPSPLSSVPNFPTSLPLTENSIVAPIPAVSTAQPTPFPANTFAQELAAPTCTTKMENGQIIGTNRGNIHQGHTLTLKNGSAGNAIAKVRDAATGRVVVSFFIAQGATASLKYLDDGNYKIQYTIGNQLDKSCKKFNLPLEAKEFSEIEHLATTRIETPKQITIRHEELTFTLYSVLSGNITPQPINREEFDAE